MLIVHSGLGITVVANSTSRTDIRAHPDRIFRVASSLNNDICSLANTNAQHVRLVGLDGYKVVGDDFHLHAIDGKALETLAADIHNAKQMFFAFTETELGIFGRFTVGRFGGRVRTGAVVWHAAVDQVVVGEGLGRGSGKSDNAFHDFLVVGMIPIGLFWWSV